MRVEAGDINSRLVEAVYLDGKRIDKATAFDDEECWVEVLKMTPDGNYEIKDDCIVREKLYGNVTVSWKK
ncbi:MAG: hypothetical protein Tp138OMZ00d2C19078261_79 [Prokaryotic dsDNA virus sp.]|jgi:hypothetical protein|nr:MAG: hypothetical protein Tp138OMZ00d2C19078261_79 [Prokaryotic dsDNA virus sp.]|tara:strand:- start:3902 stop:4111 length:210 start_codon:yes stop_codon:yes gene_type:complete